MTQIVQGNALVTVINVFTVAPQNQQALIDVLAEATEKVINTQPGFISANIHRGLDGTHVANYAQWRSREDFEIMLTKSEVRPHMEAAKRLAMAEPHLYEVAFIHEASPADHIR